jgi:hypothetical protein
MLATPDDWFNIPFGGKPVVLGGDFYQALPVETRVPESDLIDHSFRHSHLYPRCNKFYLKVNMRVEKLILHTADPVKKQRLREWADSLIKIGDGLTGPTVNIPRDQCIAYTCDDDVDQFISRVHGDLSSIDPYNTSALIDTFKSTILLAPLNEDTYMLNDHAISMFPGQSHIIHATDMFDDVSARLYQGMSDTYMHMINPPRFPAHSLTLKVGMPLMVLRNINISAGLANGTRVFLLKINRYSLLCRISAV